jgi:hypothetical protein
MCINQSWEGKTIPENSPQVHKTTFGKKDDVTTGGHCEAVNLRLDINCLLRVGLEPGNINFNIKVANAIRIVN